MHIINKQEAQSTSKAPKYLWTVAKEIQGARTSIWTHTRKTLVPEQWGLKLNIVAKYNNSDWKDTLPAETDPEGLHWAHWKQLSSVVLVEPELVGSQPAHLQVVGLQVGLQLVQEYPENFTFSG